MRRKIKPPFLYFGLLRNIPLDFNGASAAGPQPSTMNSFSDAVVERKLCTEKYLPQVRAFLTFNELV